MNNLEKVSATVLVFIITLFSVSPAKEKDLRTQNASSVLGTPQSSMLNIGRIAAWYSANGEQERIPSTGNSGLTYPRLTATAMYSAGILWGGIFNDGRTPTLRMNGQSYNNGTRPGAILGLRTGIAEDPTSSNVRIWRIRRDYTNADLKQDAAEINNIPVNTVPDTMIRVIRLQYARDWAEWPWQKGAPFYDNGYLSTNGVDTLGRNNGVLDWGEDLNRNGVLDAGEDTNNNSQLDGESPGIANADQVLWYVCNDIGVSQPWTCLETGIEEQATIWGYNRTDAVGNAIFKRFRIIYKGTAATPASATIDSMYVAQWSDPDIGDPGDDFVGCDTTQNFGYAYNARPSDQNYQQFHLGPPAIGNILLQGPMQRTGNPADTAVFDFKKVTGATNMRMTSFMYFAAGGVYSDPPFSYDGAIQYYQLLRGFPPIPQGPPDPPRIINPATNQRTPFLLSGNPVTGTGWRDGTPDNPGDRRYMLSSGPFRMAVGDTQEIVTAVVAGLGSSNYSSITVLKFNASNTKALYTSMVRNNTTDVSLSTNSPSKVYVLHQNYPNPFNPSTTIKFQIPCRSKVSLKVFDVIGREVATLVDAEEEPGLKSVQFNASELASGIYFYQLRAGAFVSTKKLLLLR